MKLLKKIINQIFNFFYVFKWSKKVTLLGDKVHFFRSTKIQFTHGSNKDNIKIDSYARIYGRLTSCKTGKIEIGKHSHIGPDTKILSVNSIRIGEYTTVAPNVIIVDNNNHPLHPYDRKLMCQVPQGAFEKSWIVSENKPIIIGDVVWIGENSRICKGVTIGDNSIIAANSVVTKDVPANCIVAGIPARVVKENILQTTKSVFEKSVKEQ